MVSPSLRGVVSESPCCIGACAVAMPGSALRNSAHRCWSLAVLNQAEESRHSTTFPALCGRALASVQRQEAHSGLTGDIPRPAAPTRCTTPRPAGHPAAPEWCLPQSAPGCPSQRVCCDATFTANSYADMLASIHPKPTSRMTPPIAIRASRCEQAPTPQ